MKVVPISDTHCQLNKISIPDGDMVIHAGDALSHGTLKEFLRFIGRYSKLPHKYKIYVPGNHDIVTEEDETFCRRECENKGIIYLNDSGVEIEETMIWGSAITPRFHNWAWNRDSGTCGTSYTENNPDYDPIDSHWEQIPEDTDILVTHGPPHGILDLSIYSGDYCGCKILGRKIKEIKPKYHVFGHIHHWGGRSQKMYGTTYINASVCNERYDPVNDIITIDTSE